MTREDMYKKYGSPYPTGHIVTVDVKEKAITIAGNHKKLLIRYVRKNPLLVKDLKEGQDPYYKPAYKIIKGAPIGVLVAFEDEGKILVGWSQRHSTREDLPFTRGDARVCAVLRGLLDAIILKSKENVSTTIENQYIPTPLKYHIPSFINRSLRYFKVEKIANVSDERKKNEEN